jgi:Nucleotidyl transferase AbiEii toxin, Type IV TA system
MPPSRLTSLQQRVLLALAGIQPSWTLTGGGALAGVHFGHRTTRDLDLFWHGISALAELPVAVERRLAAAGLQVDSLQTEPAFRRMRVSDGQEVVILDLVADAVPTIEPPQMAQLGGTSILVDTPYEILVNKLCALLGRAEARDLIDVRLLLQSGLDLHRALTDVPKKDGGFSALTLSWVLHQPAIDGAIHAAGLDASERADLLVFRDDLVDRLVRAATPGSPKGDDREPSR